MATVRTFLSVVAISSFGLSTLLAQVVVIQQPRDTTPVAAQPTERRVPVGTSSISGAVVTADTGRPVRGARVSVNGQVTANMLLMSGARGRGNAPGGTAPPPAVQVLTRGGVSVTVQTPGGAGTPSGVSRTVMTDANGQFSFPRLPAGQFQLSIYHSQFLQLNYGQRRAGGQGTYIQLADGQQLSINVPMQRGAVIAGTVLGPDGEPQPYAQIRGWRYVMNNGFRRLQSLGYASADDRGVYRLFGLQPGDYIVSATPNASDAMNTERFNAQNDLIERAIASGQVIPPAAPGLTPTVSVPVVPPPAPNSSSMMTPVYLPTFAPSSMTASGATTLTVAGGEERMGVDILVRLIQATNVQGEVATPLDSGVAVQLSLISDEPGVDAVEGSSTRADPTGKFSFRGLKPGKYTVLAQTIAAPPMNFVNGQPMPPSQPPTLTDAQKLWGRAQIVVAGEPVVNVRLPLQQTRSISGVVAFDMARPPDLSRSRMTVMLSAAPTPQQVYYSAPPQAQVGPDGRFTLTGVVPGRWFIRTSGGGVLKSAVVAGQDTLDFPLEFTGDRDVTDALLTLTDTSSELSGTLTDSAGKPAPDYNIVVAASDSRYWIPGTRRVSLARPGPDGRFVFRGLPPGSYLIAAVIDPEPGSQYDPEFLRSLAVASVSVTVLEGGKVVQDLRVK